jgi:hypothetical protein
MSRIRLIALGIGLTFAVPAWATTDLDSFTKLLLKYAVDLGHFGSPLKAKSACVCDDGSQAPGVVGLDPIGVPGILYCVLPTFDSSGAPQGIPTLCPHFEVLGK